MEDKKIDVIESDDEIAINEFEGMFDCNGNPVVLSVITSQCKFSVGMIMGIEDIDDKLYPPVFSSKTYNNEMRKDTRGSIFSTPIGGVSRQCFSSVESVGFSGGTRAGGRYSK